MSRLGGRQVWVFELANQSVMFLGRKRAGEESVTPTRWKEDNRVTEVENGHQTSLIEAPTVAYYRRYAHLTASGDQELSC